VATSRTPWRSPGTLRGGDKYVAILGPGLAKKVLDAGLLDEILVHVAPVLLGDGVRLFDPLGGANIKLEPTGHAAQMTNLWMRIRR
jgi:riboflavin biosynthesis pyrimidine reductase